MAREGSDAFFHFGVDIEEAAARIRSGMDQISADIGRRKSVNTSMFTGVVEAAESAALKAQKALAGVGNVTYQNVTSRRISGQGGLQDFEKQYAALRKAELRNVGEQISKAGRAAGLQDSEIQTLTRTGKAEVKAALTRLYKEVVASLARDVGFNRTNGGVKAFRAGEVGPNEVRKSNVPPSLPTPSDKTYAKAEFKADQKAPLPSVPAGPLTAPSDVVRRLAQIEAERKAAGGKGSNAAAPNLAAVREYEKQERDRITAAKKLQSEATAQFKREGIEARKEIKAFDDRERQIAAARAKEFGQDYREAHRINRDTGTQGRDIKAEAKAEQDLQTKRQRDADALAKQKQVEADRAARKEERTQQQRINTAFSAATRENEARDKAAKERANYERVTTDPLYRQHNGNFVGPNDVYRIGGAGAQQVTNPGRVQAIREAQQQAQPPSLGQAFLGGLTSSGFGSRATGFDSTGIARSFGSTIKFSLQYQALQSLIGAYQDTIKEAVDYRDSLTDLNVALGQGEKAGAGYVTQLSNIARLSGASVGEALDSAARGVRALTNPTDSRDVKEQTGLQFADAANRAAIIAGKSLSDVRGDIIAIATTYGVAADRLQDINDAVAGSKLFGGDPAQVSQGLASGGVALQNAGFSLKESGAIVSTVITKIDESGQLAANRITRITQALQGSPGRSLVSSLGIDPSLDARGTLLEIARRNSLVAGQEGALNKTQKQQVQSTLGGISGGRETSVILDALAPTGSLFQGFTEGFDFAGKGASEFDRKISDLAGTLKVLTGTVKAIQNGLFDAGLFAPFEAGLLVLKPTLELLNNIISAYNRFFELAKNAASIVPGGEGFVDKGLKNVLALYLEYRAALAIISFLRKKQVVEGAAEASAEVSQETLKTRAAAAGAAARGTIYERAANTRMRFAAAAAAATDRAGRAADTVFSTAPGRAATAAATTAARAAAAAQAQYTVAPGAVVPPRRPAPPTATGADGTATFIAGPGGTERTNVIRAQVADEAIRARAAFAAQRAEEARARAAAAATEAIREETVAESQLAAARLRAAAAGPLGVTTGQRQIRIGQAGLTVGQAGLTTGQRQIGVGPLGITTGQRQIDVGQRQVGIGPLGITTGQRQIEVGQRQIGVGQRQIDVGQRQIGVGQRQIGTGQRQIGTGQQQIGTGQRQLGPGTGPRLGPIAPTNFPRVDGPIATPYRDDRPNAFLRQRGDIPLTVEQRLAAIRASAAGQTALAITAEERLTNVRRAAIRNIVREGFAGDPRLGVLPARPAPLPPRPPGPLALGPGPLGPRAVDSRPAPRAITAGSPAAAQAAAEAELLAIRQALTAEAAAAVAAEQAYRTAMFDSFGAVQLTAVAEAKLAVQRGLLRSLPGLKVPGTQQATFLNAREAGETQAIAAAQAELLAIRSALASEAAAATAAEQAYRAAMFDSFGAVELTAGAEARLLVQRGLLRAFPGLQPPNTQQAVFLNALEQAEHRVAQAAAARAVAEIEAGKATEAAALRAIAAQEALRGRLVTSQAAYVAGLPQLKAIDSVQGQARAAAAEAARARLVQNQASFVAGLPQVRSADTIQGQARNARYSVGQQIAHEEIVKKFPNIQGEQYDAARARNAETAAAAIKAEAAAEAELAAARKAAGTAQVSVRPASALSSTAAIQAETVAEERLAAARAGNLVVLEGEIVEEGSESAVRVASARIVDAETLSIETNTQARVANRLAITRGPLGLGAGGAGGGAGRGAAGSLGAGRAPLAITSGAAAVEKEAAKASKIGAGLFSGLLGKFLIFGTAALLVSQAVAALNEAAKKAREGLQKTTEALNDLDRASTSKQIRDSAQAFRDAAAANDKASSGFFGNLRDGVDKLLHPGDIAHDQEALGKSNRQAARLQEDEQKRLAAIEKANGPLDVSAFGDPHNLDNLTDGIDNLTKAGDSATTRVGKLNLALQALVPRGPDGSLLPGEAAAFGKRVAGTAIPNLSDALRDSILNTDPNLVQGRNMTQKSLGQRSINTEEQRLLGDQAKGSVTDRNAAAQRALKEIQDRIASQTNAEKYDAQGNKTPEFEREQRREEDLKRLIAAEDADRKRAVDLASKQIGQVLKPADRAKLSAELASITENFLNENGLAGGGVLNPQQVDELAHLLAAQTVKGFGKDKDDLRQKSYEAYKQALANGGGVSNVKLDDVTNQGVQALQIDQGNQAAQEAALSSGNDPLTLAQAQLDAAQKAASDAIKRGNVVTDQTKIAILQGTNAVAAALEARAQADFALAKAVFGSDRAVTNAGVDVNAARDALYYAIAHGSKADQAKAMADLTAAQDNLIKSQVDAANAQADAAVNPRDSRAQAVQSIADINAKLAITPQFEKDPNTGLDTTQQTAAYSQLIQQRAAAQAALDDNDLKLAHLQRDKNQNRHDTLAQATRDTKDAKAFMDAQIPNTIEYFNARDEYFASLDHEAELRRSKAASQRALNRDSRDTVGVAQDAAANAQDLLNGTDPSDPNYGNLFRDAADKAQAALEVQASLDNAIGRAAVDPRSAVSGAQEALDEANRELGLQKQGWEGYYAALARSRQAAIDLQRAVNDAAAVKALLNSDFTDPTNQAHIATQTAIANRNDVYNNPLSDENSKNAADLDVKQKQAAEENTAREQRLAQLRSNLDLGRISHQEYIRGLEAEKARLEAVGQLTYEQDQALRKITGLIQDSAKSVGGNFNIGEIDVPSVYAVRSSIANARTAANGAGGNTQNVNVTINGGDMDQVRTVLSKYLGPSNFANNTGSTPKV